MTFAPAIGAFIDTGNDEDAIKLIRKYPKAVDTLTRDGSALFSSAIRRNSAALVNAFLDAGSNPLHSSGASNHMPHIIDAAAFPASLHAILSHPKANIPRLLGAQTYDGETLLQRLVNVYTQTPRDERAPVSELPSITLLLDHGAGVDQRSRDEANPLMLACKVPSEEYALPLPVFDRMAAASRALEERHHGHTPLLLAMRGLPFSYTTALLKKGADACALLPTGEDAQHLPRLDANHPLFNPDVPQYNSNRNALKIYMIYQREEDRSDFSRSPDALRERYIDANGHATELLLKALGSNMLTAAVSANYWKQHGTIEQGMAFAGELRHSLPAHLAHLGNRIDTISLARELKTPREHSVLVSHLRADTPERGVV